MPNPFDQNENAAPQSTNFQDKTPQEFMEELVGDGKKYATPEDAVRALAHASNHISTLEGENAGYKTKLEKASTVEDILSKMTQHKDVTGTDTGAADQATTAPSQEQPNVEELVKQMMSQQQSEQAAAANRDKVVNALKSQFGGKAGEVWDAAEASLGVDLDSLCASSPQAALKLLGAAGEGQSVATSESLASGIRPPQGEPRPPEGSKRSVDFMLSKGEISRQDAYKMKLALSADPVKFNA